MSNLQDAVKILKELEEYKEFVNLALDEVTPFIDRFAMYTVDTRISMIKRYQEAGFTKEESIYMTLDTTKQLGKSLQNASNAIKK